MKHKGETSSALHLLLREASFREASGGAYEATILREGPGNAGDRNYYTKEALRKAVADGKFDGLQAYLNHPTRTDERERPERDVRHLAGQFREARFVDGSPAEVRAKFIPGGMEVEKVKNLIESALASPAGKPLVGISIDGHGVSEVGEVGGQQFNIVREIAHLGSADIVTRAGAGGRFHRRLQEADRALQEGTYTTHDGRTVYFDDGKETLRDAADLYAVTPELQPGGSPNLENLKARHIMDRIQTGLGLGQTHLSTLTELLAKHKDAIEELRSSRDRRGQDWLATGSAGAHGSIVDTSALPAKTQESSAMREANQEAVMDDDSWEGMEETFLIFMGVEEGLMPAKAAAPDMPRGFRCSLREAVGMGELTLDDVILGTDRLREFHATHYDDADVLERLGIEPGDLGK